MVPSAVFSKPLAASVLDIFTADENGGRPALHFLHHRWLVQPILSHRLVVYIKSRPPDDREMCTHFTGKIEGVPRRLSISDRKVAAPRLGLRAPPVQQHFSVSSGKVARRYVVLTQVQNHPKPARPKAPISMSSRPRTWLSSLFTNSVTSSFVEA